jgi:hypothetical protein
MPTGSGQLELQDYDAALIARGFDAFQQGERYQMINLGYRYVARQFPWSWEQTSQSYSVSGGSPVIATGSGLPNGIDSIIGVDLASAPGPRKLEAETQIRFETRWRYLDMTQQQNWGQVARYYYFDGQILALPPNQAAATYKVYYRQYLPDMVNISDTTVMPQIYDEIILDAALVRCHRRAHELQLSAEAQARVDAAINDMLQDDVWDMEELQERTLPDNQWW